MARTAKDRALLLLGVRSRSREEIRRRLRSAGFGDEEVEAALGDLERVGLVDDALFARDVVRSRATRRAMGNRAIRGSLYQKGVARETIDEAMLEAGDEKERARALALSRAERLRGEGPEVCLRRVLGLLLRRGFCPDTARAAAAEAVSCVFGPSGEDGEGG